MSDHQTHNIEKLLKILNQSKAQLPDSARKLFFYKTDSGLGEIYKKKLVLNHTKAMFFYILGK